MDLIKHYTVVRSKIYHFHVKKRVQTPTHTYTHKRIHMYFHTRIYFPYRARHTVAWECEGLITAMSSYMYIVSCYRQKYIFFESARNRPIWTRSSVLSCSTQYDITPVFCGQLASHFYRNTLDGAMHKFIINKQSIIYFVAIQ